MTKSCRWDCGKIKRLGGAHNEQLTHHMTNIVQFGLSNSILTAYFADKTLENFGSPSVFLYVVWQKLSLLILRKIQTNWSLRFEKNWPPIREKECLKIIFKMAENPDFQNSIAKKIIEELWDRNQKSVYQRTKYCQNLSEVIEKIRQRSRYIMGFEQIFCRKWNKKYLFLISLGWVSEGSEIQNDWLFLLAKFDMTVLKNLNLQIEKFKVKSNFDRICCNEIAVERRKIIFVP